MADYCVPSDVSDLIQPMKPFSDGGVGSPPITSPTATAVTGFITKITAEINVFLAAAGYILPITGTNNLVYLKLVCSVGAAYLAEAGRTGESSLDESSRAKILRDTYRAYLKDFIKMPGLLDGSVSNPDIPVSMSSLRIVDGSDPNYSNNDPVVTRDTLS